MKARYEPTISSIFIDMDNKRYSLRQVSAMLLTVSDCPGSEKQPWSELVQLLFPSVLHVRVSDQVSKTTAGSTSFDRARILESVLITAPRMGLERKKRAARLRAIIVTVQNGSGYKLLAVVVEGEDDAVMG